jgi:uncharacterized MAPEG superfamily protein
MTIAFWCVLAAGLLPLVWVGYAKATGGRYDNRAPREFLAGVSGGAQRAHWAEQNSYEAFPLFAAGVVVAHLAGADPDTANLLALVFVAARAVHGVCYIADLATLRSLVWLIGLGCSVGLFVSAV